VHPTPSSAGRRSAAGALLAGPTSGGEEELYSQATDPHQVNNLAGDPTRDGTLRRLRARARTGCAPEPPGFDW